MRRRLDKALWLLAMAGILANLAMSYSVWSVTSRLGDAFARQDRDRECENLGYVKANELLKGAMRQ